MDICPFVRADLKIYTVGEVNNHRRARTIVRRVMKGALVIGVFAAGIMLGAQVAKARQVQGPDLIMNKLFDKAAAARGSTSDSMTCVKVPDIECHESRQLICEKRDPKTLRIIRAVWSC